MRLNGKNRFPHSLAVALEEGLIPYPYQAMAIEIISRYPYPRTPTTALPARSKYNDPGWDNVIRAYEEWEAE